MLDSRIALAVAAGAFVVCIIITALTGMLIHWAFAGAAVAILWVALNPPNEPPKSKRKK